MTNDAAMGHGPRLLRQKRAHAHTDLEKRQGRTTTTSVTRVRAADETTITRVRTTVTPDAVDDAATTTTRARAPATTTNARAAAPAADAATTAAVVGSSAVAAVPIASSVPRIASSPAVLVGTVSVTQSASADQANGSTTGTTTRSGGLSKGATIGVAVAASIIGLLLLGFIGSTLWRRRKAKGANGGDYSWSSREKEDLFGPSPSRNVMSDASFGNSPAPNMLASAYRPLSGEESRRMLLGGAPSMRDARSTNNFSEAMFSQPKQQQQHTAPRASFMAGPTGPPPSVGALYGQSAPAGQQQSPFDDSHQYQGKMFVVRRTFEPSLADELIIYPGDRIEIITVYDDGWCLGINLDSAKPGQEPQKGVFPRDCVEEMGSQDTPLNSGPAGLQRAPTLPPMSFENGTAPPAISVSSPEKAHGQHGSSNGSNILSRFPNTPARDPLRRTSSLLASGKDAELYKALGDAIDRRDADRRI